MEKISRTLGKKNYKITIIFVDEVVTAKFYNRYQAIDTVKKMKEEYPDLFMCGAVEEKSRYWNVIWTLEGNLQES